ncbi:hypothetical protein ACGF1Z_20250 [Streptomyces sp. NPDC048018]|uniref:hypothetical protein n=1 Tax=Streptomyces sp. NPDC048018 TaxID=3365499 RepID=UPI0037150B3D
MSRAPDPGPGPGPNPGPAFGPDPAPGSAPGSARDPGPARDPGRTVGPGPARDPGPAFGPGPGPAPASGPDPDRDPERHSDHAADARLRAVFARAAYDVTPSPVPLAAVRRRGRAHRRRRTVTLAVLAVLSVSGASAVAALSLPGEHDRPVRGAPAVPSVRAVPTGTAGPGRAAGPRVTPVREVRAGQRVDAGRGWRVWLTSEGKHWSGTESEENFRSVTDGNVETSTPGISAQSEGGPSGIFLSGLYYGTRAVGRVELRDADGRTALATLLELPGRPGWGVWYAHMPASLREPGSTPDLALYDRTGRRLADLDGMPGS